jgi:hypothetical protein
MISPYRTYFNNNWQWFQKGIIADYTAYPIIEPGNLVHYAIQIDMSDLTTDTDATRGLYSGFFRWVTERPQYDGVTVIPTGDNDGNIWKEGIIINRAQISSSVRMINVNRAGDYGSLSGVNLAIDNTSDFTATYKGFDDYLLSNDYEIINRPVKFYVVFNNVFYQIWGGIVSKIDYDELMFKFVCKDIFETAHKPFPPREVTRTNFPLADPDSVGKTLPVLFGDVLRTEIVNITGISEPVLLTRDVNTDNAIEVTAATNYGIQAGEIYLTVITEGIEFPGFYFSEGDYFLVGFRGTEEAVRIIANGSTASGTTKLQLGSKLSVDTTDFNANYAYPTSGTVNNNVWFFKVYAMDRKYLVSNSAINSFVQDDLNAFDIVQWNKDRQSFDPVPELLSDTDDTDTGLYPHPNINLINANIQLQNNIIRRVPI